MLGGVSGYLSMCVGFRYTEMVGVPVFLAPWSVSDYSDVRGVPLQPGPKVGINFIYNFHWLDKCEHE